jgi:uncharacterized protein YndB with AHSA1/START domain
MGNETANEFVISKVLKAPREKVWRAWTDRDELMKWFGPKGCTIPVANLDLRPGGIFHYAMRTPDGKEMWGKWTFREIEAPNRLVLISCFSDKEGGITRHPMASDWPLQTLSTTTFEAQGDSTVLTIRWSPWNATEAEISRFNASHDSMTQGWGGTYEQLAAYLAAN